MKSPSFRWFTTVLQSLAYFMHNLSLVLLPVQRNPLTQEHMRECVARNEDVKGIIEVDTEEFHERDVEQFYDYIAELLTGSSALKCTDYKVVGIGRNGCTLLLEVSGDASLIVNEDSEEK